MQIGYFAGSIAGGAALIVGGYSALGATMGALFLAAAATLAHEPASRRGSHLARARALYRFSTGREGDRQPACDPVTRFRTPTRPTAPPGTVRQPGRW